MWESRGCHIIFTVESENDIIESLNCDQLIKKNLLMGFHTAEPHLME